LVQMKILILGSEGFIGSNLIGYYTGQKHEVFGCDLTPSTDAVVYTYIHNDGRQNFWPELFESHQFDFCINASGSGNVGTSIKYPLKDFNANCHEVIKVLDAARVYNRSVKYLHISSAAVYGNPEKLPVNESDSLNPLSPYGWHKLLSEQVCKEY